MERECRKNITELHVFIESWLKGAVEKTKQEFRYFEDSLDEEFIIIHPTGVLQDKLDIIGDFWSAYGVQSEDFSIEIRNTQVRFESENMCILTYEEWQTGVEKTARISTVVFRKSINSNTNSWLHLHETWCPSNYYKHA